MHNGSFEYLIKLSGKKGVGKSFFKANLPLYRVNLAEWLKWFSGFIEKKKETEESENSCQSSSPLLPNFKIKF